jgi:hypothetical protein
MTLTSCIKRTCAVYGPVKFICREIRITANAPPSCLHLRDTADLRDHSSIALLQVGLLRVFLYRRPWALEALRHVIGRDLHLRAAAELKTTGSHLAAHGSSISYLSGTRYPLDPANHAR